MSAEGSLFDKRAARIPATLLAFEWHHPVFHRRLREWHTPYQQVNHEDFEASESTGLARFHSILAANRLRMPFIPLFDQCEIGRLNTLINLIGLGASRAFPH